MARITKKVVVVAEEKKVEAIDEPIVEVKKEKIIKEMPEIIYLESESTSALWMVSKYNDTKYTAIGLKDKYSLNNQFVKVNDNANKNIPPNIPLSWFKIKNEDQVGILDLIDKPDNIKFADNWNSQISY